VRKLISSGSPFEPTIQRLPWDWSFITSVQPRVKTIWEPSGRFSLAPYPSINVRLTMVPASEKAQAAVREAMVHAGLIN